MRYRLIDSKLIAKVNRLPILSTVSQPEPLSMCVSSGEEILEAEPVIMLKTGSSAAALKVKCKKITRALIDKERPGEI